MVSGLGKYLGLVLNIANGRENQRRWQPELERKISRRLVLKSLLPWNKVQIPQCSTQDAQHLAPATKPHFSLLPAIHSRLSDSRHCATFQPYSAQLSSGLASTTILRLQRSLSSSPITQPYIYTGDLHSPVIFLLVFSVLDYTVIIIFFF